MAAKSEKHKLMTAEYGISSGNICGNCCNFQTPSHATGRKVCIAYGDVTWTDCTWEFTCAACGLYNRAFAGLQPKRRPLAEAYLNPPASKARDEDQMNLF